VLLKRCASASSSARLFARIAAVGGKLPISLLNLSQNVLELIPVSFEAFAQGHNLCIAAGQVRIPLVFVERCDVHRRDGAVLAEIGAPRRLTLAALRAARSCHLLIIDRASNSAFLRPVTTILGLSMSAG
jgi:hypothetical protein